MVVLGKSVAADDQLPSCPVDVLPFEPQGFVPSRPAEAHELHVVAELLAVPALRDRLVAECLDWDQS